jgi:hypothetical protein
MKWNFPFWKWQISSVWISRLAEVLGKHIAEQRALIDGVVEGDVGMGRRVEPMCGHAAFCANAIERRNQGFR